MWLLVVPKTVFAGVPLYSKVALSNVAFSLDLEIILFCDYVIVFNYFYAFILGEPCELPCQELNQSMPGTGRTSSSSAVAGASSSSTSSTSTTSATSAAVGSTNTPDVNGGGSSSGSSSSHHSPYDLRRKSPPHHYAAASTSGSPISSVLASTNYSTSMLPARKRPRRTCSVTNESEYTVVTTFMFREGYMTQLIQLQTF